MVRIPLIQLRVRLPSFPCSILAVLLLSLFAAAEALAGTPKVILAGDEVKVTIGPAPVMDGERTLATVKAGTVLTAIDVRGQWVQVKVETDEGRVTGWIKTLHLRPTGSAPTPKEEGGAKPPQPVASPTKATVEKVEPAGPRDTIRRLVVDLQRGNWGQRYAAASALYGMGEAARPAAPSLADAIAREDNLGGPQAFSLLALGNVGSAGALAVPGLIKILEDRTRWGSEQAIAVFAIRALCEIGPAAKDAIPALKDLAWRQGTNVRLPARLALACIAPSDPEAVRTLVQVLEESRLAALRWRAARALGRMGARAQEALPALSEAEKDRDSLVRLMATCAKARIEQEPARATPLLKQAMEGPDRLLCDRAREAVAELQARE